MYVCTLGLYKNKPGVKWQSYISKEKQTYYIKYHTLLYLDLTCFKPFTVYLCTCIKTFSLPGVAI